MAEERKSWASWKRKYQKEVMADLKTWFVEERSIGDRFSVTLDPCGGCSKYVKHRRECGSSWAKCKGKHWQPREK